MIILTFIIWQMISPSLRAIENHFCHLCAISNSITLLSVYWSTQHLIDRYHICHHEWQKTPVTFHTAQTEPSPLTPALLASQLNALFPSTNDQARATTHNIFHFSNEWETWHRGFDYTQQALEKKPVQASTGIRSSILIGHSSFHTLLPILSKHSDLVIFLDISTSQLKWTEDSLQALRQANFEDEEAYIKQLESAAHLPEQTLQNEYEKNREVTGEWHPWHSLARFQEIQQAIDDLTFSFVNIDILDQAAMELLSKTLREAGAQIVFTNISNVLEWIPEPTGRQAAIVHLAQLPGILQSPFAYSSLMYSQYTALQNGLQPIEILNEYNCLMNSPP